MFQNLSTIAFLVFCKLTLESIPLENSEQFLKKNRVNMHKECAPVPQSKYLKAFRIYMYQVSYQHHEDSEVTKFVGL